MGLRRNLQLERSKYFLKATILILILIVGFLNRLYSVLKYESLIHEFDPWFNYRASKLMVENSFYDLINWFDESSWYPLGRNVGATLYPGLMATAGFFHRILNSLKIPVHIREVCVFIPAFYSGFMSLAIFLLTSQVWNSSAGLIAAFLVSIVPGYVSRSMAGSYDYECISVFILMFTFYLWARSVKSGSVFWAVFTAFFYLYAVSSWGGYIYVINVIPLHVVILILSGRYSSRLFCAYSTFYVLGLLLSMQVPFVGFLPLKSSEHMPSLMTFLLLCGYAFFQHVGSITDSRWAAKFMIFLLSSSAVLLFSLLLLLTSLGVISPWTGRLYSLFDTSYAAIHIPIISSVAEHQISSWTRYFMDLHFLPCFFPVGIWLSFDKLSDQMVLVLVMAITSAYFSGIMVRLIIILTPILCLVSSFTYDRLIRKLKNDYEAEGGQKIKSYLSFLAITAITGLLIVHSTWISVAMYSGTSIVMDGQGSDGSRIIIDDYREAYYWLNRNTPKDAKVLSWWDYGYQISGFSNRTTIVDNNTWNNTHIAIVGKTMASNESRAFELLRELDVDYVLVIFGGYSGYDSDDIAKFLWMVRISEGEFPNEIHENQYYTASGNYRIGDGVSHTMKSSLMYRLCYYRFHQTETRGFDNSRKEVAGHRVDKLEFLDEAFSSLRWIVRIFRVKGYPRLNRLSYKPVGLSVGSGGKKSSVRGSLKSRHVIKQYSV